MKKYSLNGILPKVYGTVEDLGIPVVLHKENGEYLTIDAEKVDSRSWSSVKLIYQKKVDDNYWFVMKANVTRDDWKYIVTWTLRHHANSTALYDDCQDYEVSDSFPPPFDPDAEIWEIQEECLNRTIDQLQFERDWHYKRYNKGIVVLESLK